MTQRHLNVKVSAQVDKSLTDLLTKLDKYKNSTLVIKTKVVMNDKGFTTFIDKVKSVSNTKIVPKIDLSKIKEMQSYLVKVTKGTNTVNVSVKVHNKDVIEKLNTARVKLSSKPTIVKVQDSGIKATLSNLERIKSILNSISHKEGRAKLVLNGLDTVKTGVATVKSKIQALTSKTHTVSFNQKGLDNLVSSLDSVSKKILNFTARGTMNIGRALGTQAGELFDAQEGFRQQALNLGVNDKSVNHAMKQLNEFGALSKYSVAELNNLAIALKGAGFDEISDEGFIGLTKNLANLTSLSPNASAALKRVSTQVKQMTLDGKIYARDWNAIRDNIGGYASKKIVDAFKARGIDDFTKALSDGVIRGKEFLEVLNEVGQDKTLSEMARQTTTLKSAWDNMVESLVVDLVGTSYNKGALSPLIEDIVKLMNTVQKATPTITKEVEGMVSKFRELIRVNFKNFDFNKLFKGFIQGLKPLGKALEVAIKLLGKLTNGGADIGKFAGYAISLSTFWLAMRKGTSALQALKGVLPVLSLFSGGLSKLFGVLGRGSKSGSGGSLGGNPLQALNLQGLVNSLSAVTTLVGIAGSMKLMASALKDIEDINLTANTAKNLGVIATIITVAGTAMSQIGRALKLVKSSYKDLIIGGAVMLGVSGALVLIAKAFEAINKVKIDNKMDLAGNLTFMMGTLVVVGALMTGIGALMVTFPPLLAGLVVGAGVLLAIAGTLVLLTGAMALVARGVEDVAKTIKRIGEIDLPEPDDFIEKLNKLGIMATKLATFSGHHGLESTLAGIPAFFGALGNLAQGWYVDTLVDLVNKVKETISVAESIPDEGAMDNAKTKLKSLMKFLNGDGGLLDIGESKGLDLFVFLGSLSDALTNMAQWLEIGTFKSNIEKLVEFVNYMSSAEIPEDLSGIKRKIKSIQEIGKMMSELSREMSGGMFASFSAGVSSGNQTKELKNIIKTIKEINKFVEELNGIPTPNVASIKTKLNKVKELMEYLKEVFNNQSSWFDWNISASWSASNKEKEISDLITALGKIIKAIGNLKKLKIDGSVVTSIENKIKSISEVFTAIKDTLDTQDFDMPKGLESKITQIDKLVEQINTIFTKIEGINQTDVSGTIGVIKTNLTEIKSLAKHKIFDEGVITKDLSNVIGQLSKFIDSLTQIATNLDKINGLGDFSDVPSKVSNITQAIVALDDEELQGAILAFKQRTDPTDALDKVKSLVDGLVKIAEVLNTMPSVSYTIVETRVGFIKSALQALDNDELRTVINKLRYSVQAYESVSSVVESLKSTAQSLKGLPDISENDVPDRVGYIKKALEKISEITSYIDGLSAKTESFTSANSVIVSLNDIANSLLALPDLSQFDNENTIGKIGTALFDISYGLSPNLLNMDSLLERLGVAKSVLTELKDLADNINTFPPVDSTAVVGSITAINDIMTKLSELTVDDGIIGNIKNVVLELENLKVAISKLSSTVGELGTTSGTNYANGWITGLGNKIETKLQQVITAIIAFDWNGTGNTTGSALASGFESGVGNKIADKANQQRRAIESLDWAGTGARISQALTNAFDISGILAKIQQIQSAINSLQGKTIDVTINQTTVERTVKRQHGGIIPEYHSTGGTVGRGWKQSGTDTVPAMLTAGEYVLKRSVTSALGTQFLNALNNMNLTTALRHLQNKVGNTVTNNNYTITQNVDNKASFMNGLNDLKGVVRP